MAAAASAAEFTVATTSDVSGLLGSLPLSGGESLELPFRTDSVRPLRGVKIAAESAAHAERSQSLRSAVFGSQRVARRAGTHVRTRREEPGSSVPAEQRGTFGVGDVWTWVAIDADSKLILSWLVGPRNAGSAYELIQDLSGRLRNRVQLTTDGNSCYIAAVEFGADIDYAILQKIYGRDPENETRYSPAKVISTFSEVITGEPDPKHVSTSYIERQNLTMRMSMRRFTRLTNGFSKKLSNHTAAIALHYMHYNFARVHRTLRVTPAMEGGLADHVWSIAEIVGLLEMVEKEPAA